MQTKPTGPVELQEGTLACSKANPEFRAFFNWMAAAFYNMLSGTDAKNGKYGLKIDLTIQDNPKIKVVYV